MKAPRGRLGILLAAAALLLVGCRDHLPQSGLNPAGPEAGSIFGLFSVVFWIAVAVFVVVEGLLLIALIRFRHRPGRAAAPPQIHGNKWMEIAWTIAPAVLLAGVAVPTIQHVFALSHRPAGNVLDIDVTGHQWWWDVEYPSMKLRTANEIHIPVDRPVYITLKSIDVIHSFWVPRLAGKQDLEPGHTNYLTIEADAPGIYVGQCAEYCGASHANMRFKVIAQTATDFNNWVLGQQQAGHPPPPPALAIMQSEGCGGCHTINGAEGFVGEVGPNLTHFASRTSFAGATLQNTPGNLAKWLHDPQALKPHNDMQLPRRLSPEEIQTLVAYLRSLK